MKLLTFRLEGMERLGWLQDDGQTVLAVDPSDQDTPQSMMSVIRCGADGRNQLASKKSNFEQFRIDDLDILPPVVPEGIFCVGLNYAAHAKEMGKKTTDHPTLFWRLPRNHVAHKQPIWVPALSDTLDWEGELAVIIGKGGRHIPTDQALDHVFGYSIYNDGSVREYQRHTSQFGLGKNFQATGAFGPVIVTADEFGDPYSHNIKTCIDGEQVQGASIDLIIHRIEEVIAYLSSSMELQPGDVICSGTPSGVGQGMNPPRFLKPGETVEITISGIGTLSNPVQAEPTNGSSC